MAKGRKELTVAVTKHTCHRRKTHTRNTPEIKDYIFDCWRTEHTALFEKFRRAIMLYICRTGGEESALISAGLETMTTPTIVEPDEPALIEDSRRIVGK